MNTSLRPRPLGTDTVKLASLHLFMIIWSRWPCNMVRISQLGVLLWHGWGCVGSHNYREKAMFSTCVTHRSVWTENIITLNLVHFLVSALGLSTASCSLELTGSSRLHSTDACLSPLSVSSSSYAAERYVSHCLNIAGDRCSWWGSARLCGPA